MCGICGIITCDRNELIDKQIIKKMTDTLKHRGPDDSGIYISTVCEGNIQAGLGHRRLSIIDLAGGHQPMANEDETIWISYNGEIYNHAELRKTLEKCRHKYRTVSDTETIIHLYEEYGEDCVHKLRGMFAFAIWDDINKKLFIARDRLGIKPLYYYAKDGLFIFASEIKGILASGMVPINMNISSLPEYFTFGYISNQETMFKEIQKLLPGHTLMWEKDDIRIQQYWDMKFVDDGNYKEDAYYYQRFIELFEESVQMRLMSDVPLGVFLSGGLDSSSIAAVMAKYVSEPIKTFSVGFEQQYYSEFDYAREVAQHIGAEHYEVVLKPNDFFDSLPKLIWHEDEPIKAPPSVALYYVAKLARENVKVVLTGEGSDELFAGYDDRYWVTLWNRKLAHYFGFLVPDIIRKWIIRPNLWKLPIPLKFKKVLSHTFLYHSLEPQQILFDNFYSIFTRDMQELLFSPEMQSRIDGVDPYKSSMNYLNSTNAPDFLNQMLYMDVKTYLLELLMKQDQMSMATSIESRVPFLNHELVEFAANVPPHLKLNGRIGKYIVKKMMQDMLPPRIIERKKMGFPVPMETWLKTDFDDYARSILLDQTTKERGYFNVEYVEKLLKEHTEGEKDNHSQIWSILNFELWNRIFFDEYTGQIYF